MVNFDEFFEYVFSFYGSGGLYDQGRTREQIAFATCRYLDLIAKGDLEHVHWTWGEGDSLDRERVRDIMNDLYDESKIYPEVDDVPADEFHNWCYPAVLCADSRDLA